jgi:transposase-like protein
MPCAETQGACEALREKFIHRYLRFAPKAVERLVDDWERLVTFYQFPHEYWSHSRTNNVAESPLATLRLGTTDGETLPEGLGLLYRPYIDAVAT